MEYEKIHQLDVDKVSSSLYSDCRGVAVYAREYDVMAWCGYDGGCPFSGGFLRRNNETAIHKD